MKDTISKLKGKVYGQIYEEYIVDYILFRRNELNLWDYISDDVILDHESFKGESHENSVDYDEFDRKIIVNIPTLKSKLESVKVFGDYMLNWMTAIFEIEYALDDIRLKKEIDNGVVNCETSICNAVNDYNYGNSILLKIIRFVPFFYSFLDSKTTRAMSTENPIERIKYIHAYFNTLSVVSRIGIDPYKVELFKQSYEDKLLAGYLENDHSVYPLKSFFFQNSFLEGFYLMHKNFKWFNLKDMMSISNANDNVTDLKERLALGLPIDLLDYLSVDKKRTR